MGLMKWWWTFGEKKEALWRKVIKETLWRKVIASKYGEDKRGWWPLPGPSYGWISFLVGDVSTVRGEILSKGVDFLVEDGRNVRFWRMIQWEWVPYAGCLQGFLD